MSKLKYKHIIGVDPSGNSPALKEGDGTTGIAVFNIDTNKFEEVVSIKARDFSTWQAYFQEVLLIIISMTELYDHSVVSIEDYLVYPSKAVHHTFSRCPTSMLLGYLLTELREWDINYYIRPAVEVKNRWSDEVMFKLGYIEGEYKSFEHCHGKSGFHLPDSEERLLSHHLDAMRHALHCAKLELPKNRGRLND